MTKHSVRTRLERIGLIPSVRTTSAEDARFAAEALGQAGVAIIEVPVTAPDGVDIVADLAHRLPEVIVGADVMDVETARRCREAGATFLTSPGFDPLIVEFGVAHHLLVIPGALTPTEVAAASKAGADLVKIFPCADLGERYIRALRTTFPHVPLVAAGGIDQQNVADFVLAGAAAVGVGSALVPKKAIQQRQADWIIELARRFLHLSGEARSQIAP